MTPLLLSTRGVLGSQHTDSKVLLGSAQILKLMLVPDTRRLLSLPFGRADQEVGGGGMTHQLGWSSPMPLSQG